MVTVGGAGNTPKGERYTHALSYRTDWPALCVSHGSDLAWVYPSVSMVRLDMGPCTSSRPRRIRHRDCGWGCRLPTFYSTTEVPTSWEVLHLHLPCGCGERAVVCTHLPRSSSAGLGVPTMCLTALSPKGWCVTYCCYRVTLRNRSPTQSGRTRALASGVMLAPLSDNCHHSPSLRSAQMWRSAALRALASSA